MKMAITGGSGYLGRQMAIAASTRGWQVLSLGRKQLPGKTAFQLGREIVDSSLDGVSTLVHCAYDFSLIRWDDIRRTNIEGSRKLFEAAARAGVRRIIYISSISAFAGAKSMYGRAKYEIEESASQFGAIVVRPGLIWGETPQGIYGNIVYQATRSRFLPLIDGGQQIQYMTHVADLAQFIVDIADGKIANAAPVLTLAHNRPWTFREIIEEIAAKNGHPLLSFRVPWWCVWFGLRMAEAIRLPVKFRSDSVISLINQNPSPDFSAAVEAGWQCRPFSPR